MRISTGRRAIPLAVALTFLGLGSLGGARRADGIAVAEGAYTSLASDSAGQHLVRRPEPRDPDYLIILGTPEAIAQEFPVADPTADRQVGFGIVVYTLSTPLDAILAQIGQALDRAEATGYPVLIHLDDWNYPAPSDDPATVEWTAFAPPGEDHGPVVRRRWINWGAWFTVEAPPNYESQAFRQEMRRRFGAIAQSVADRLRTWREEGRGYLLAGLVVGWESGYYTAPELIPGQEPRFADQVMTPDEQVTTGYAALAARGWTPEKLHEEMERTGETEPEVIHRLMAEVVHDYTAWLTSICRGKGIPRNRLYTHYAGTGALDEDRLPPHLKLHGVNMPLESAINESSRPGITATAAWTDLERASEVFATHGVGHWGAVEIEFTEGTRDEEDALWYLEGLSSSGARVLCVYGWWEPPGHMFAVRGSGAVPAMHRWLKGE